MKVDTKLSVVMWCQIFDRKSIAPSSGDFAGDRRRDRPVDKIRNFEITLFSKLLVRPLPRSRPELHASLTKGIFNILPPMWWG